MNIEERLQELLFATKSTAKYLESQTGIDRDRWNNARRKPPTSKIRAEEIEAITKLFPEYAYWLATGKEIPEAGQVSPETKATQDNMNLKVA
jgi:hypothetical protein